MAENLSPMEQLAADIRAKREYREEDDGTVFCKLGGCVGSTGLRCHRTGVPICQTCAIRTPVGYISREAQRAQENKFFDAATSDYLVAAAAAFFGNLFVGFFVLLVASFLPGFFGLILLFFLAGSAAGVISEIVWRALRKKRGRYTGAFVSGAVILSCFFLLPFTNPLYLLVYAFVVISTINARFQLGIRL